MPSSLNGTGVTFDDGTTQSTAATAGNYIMRTITSTSTWTKPSGLKAVKVTLVGAGGNGGTRTNTVYGSAGGNGGNGGGAIEYISAPSIPGPVSVTVGTAPSKTSSFGAFLSATGGGNGGRNRRRSQTIYCEGAQKETNCNETTNCKGKETRIDSPFDWKGATHAQRKMGKIK
jgi:hypothetical protein